MDIVLRATAMFAVLYLLLRLLGKRELAQMTPFEFVVLVVMGDLLQQGVTQTDFSMTGATLAIATFAFWGVLLNWLSYLFPRLEPVLEGEARVLIRDGRLLKGNLRADRITHHEIESAMRLAGIARVQDVAWALIEPNGKISFIRSEDCPSGGSPHVATFQQSPDPDGTPIANNDSQFNPNSKESIVPTAAKPAPAKKTPARKRSPSSGTQDAVQMLTADHREVKSLFQDYQKLVDAEAEDQEKQALAQLICTLLTVHATVEEEVFYPAAEGAIKDSDLIDEANVEHASAKDLIAQIESGDPSDKFYDAKVKVLGEYVDHHVKEEEGELFPQCRKAKMDLSAIGAQMSQRKAELMSDLGMTEEDPA